MASDHLQPVLHVPCVLLLPVHPRHGIGA
jgi:hypothetical protein